MATIRTPPERWLEEASKALAGGGPDAVRVEALADAIGVTKGGFYWHFENRDALLEGVLVRWEQESVEDVVATVESGGGDARERLRALFSLAASSRGLLRADLAIRDWARRDAAVARRLRRVDNRRMAYLRSLFAEIATDEADAEARSLLVASLWIGNHFFAADHGGLDRRQVIDAALERVLA